MIKHTPLRKACTQWWLKLPVSSKNGEVSRRSLLQAYYPTIEYGNDNISLNHMGHMFEQEKHKQFLVKYNTQYSEWIRKRSLSTKKETVA